MMRDSVSMLDKDVTSLVPIFPHPPPIILKHPKIQLSVALHLTFSKARLYLTRQISRILLMLNTPPTHTNTNDFQNPTHPNPTPYSRDPANRPIWPRPRQCIYMRLYIVRALVAGTIYRRPYSAQSQLGGLGLHTDCQQTTDCIALPRKSNTSLSSSWPEWPGRMEVWNCFIIDIARPYVAYSFRGWGY